MDNRNDVKVQTVGISDKDMFLSLRKRCIDEMCRGFFSQEVIKQVTADILTPDTERMLTSSHVSVLYRNEEPIAYAASSMTDDPAEGEIEEIGVSLSCGTHELYELATGAIRDLQQQGASRVSFQVLRDNLRLRFQMELVGFKRTCPSIKQEFGELKFEKYRYVYYMT